VYSISSNPIASLEIDFRNLAYSRRVIFVFQRFGFKRSKVKRLQAGCTRQPLRITGRDAQDLNRVFGFTIGDFLTEHVADFG